MIMTKEETQLWDKPLAPMLDEYFSPKHIKSTMSELIEEEMHDLELNPNNPEHIRAYWKTKGIDA
jgi:hypothetical protein